LVLAKDKVTHFTFRIREVDNSIKYLIYMTLIKNRYNSCNGRKTISQCFPNYTVVVAGVLNIPSSSVFICSNLKPVRQCRHTYAKASKVLGLIATILHRHWFVPIWNTAMSSHHIMRQIKHYEFKIHSHD